MTQFVPRLESLRGLAALAVAAFHINLTTWAIDGVKHPDRGCVDVNALTCAIGKIWWNVNGVSAVHLFFVLSGFVLTLSMQRKSQEGWADAPRYATARLFRLYPAIFFMVAVFGAFQLSTGIALYGGDFNFADAIKQALLINTRINGATYTLQLELIGSVLLFVAFQGDRQLGGWVSWLMFVLLSLMSFSPGAAKVLLPYGGPPLVFLSAFLAGMLSARYAARLFDGVSGRMQMIVMLLAAAVFVLSKPVISYSSGWMVLAESLSGAVLVGVVAQGRVGASLDNPAIRFLGMISYSFYLMHPLSIGIFEAYIGHARAMVPGPDIVVSMTCVALSVLITVPLAYASFILVEKPMIRLGKRLSWRSNNGARPIQRMN